MAAQTNPANLSFKMASELNSRKESLKDEYVGYVQKHPELKQIMSDFLSQILVEKPENIPSFARDYFEAYLPKPSAESPLIVCGPSGVGKGTLMKKLFAEFDGKLGMSTSHTTRNPREGEVNGEHYHFVTKEDFENDISEGRFIEHAHVHNNIYGTSYQSVKDVVSGGKVCVLEIDIQGAENVKKSDMSPRIIYIAPPSMEELEKRLRERGTEEESDIQTRLQNANDEINWLETPGNADVKIVNDNIDHAYEQLKNQLFEWYPQLL